MKRLILLAAMGLVFALSQLGFAAEKSYVYQETTVTVRTLADGTLVVTGVGDETNKSTCEPLSTDQGVPVIHAQFEKLASVGFSNGELLRFLTDKLFGAGVNKRLGEMEVLLTEIRAVLRAETFPEQDEWPYEKTGRGFEDGVRYLAATSQYDSFYGKQVVEILEILAQQYPQNKLFTSNLRIAINGRLFRDSFPKEGGPLPEEQRFFARKLLEFHRQYHEVSVYLDDEAEQQLAAIDWGVLQELKLLSALKMQASTNK